MWPKACGCLTITICGSASDCCHTVGIAPNTLNSPKTYGGHDKVSKNFCLCSMGSVDWLVYNWPVVLFTLDKEQ